MLQSGTLSLLTVRCATSGVTGDVVNVYRTPSGSSSHTATALTVPYGTTTANTVLQDTTHTTSYSIGDIITIGLLTQASTTIGGCSASFAY
jgi:hypothetical protein